MSQRYGDPSGYNITPLGTTPAGHHHHSSAEMAAAQPHLYATSSSTSSAPSDADQQLLINSAAAASDPHHHHHHQQYSSALNLFASSGNAYPATPAALMHSAMGPLLSAGAMGGTMATAPGGDAESEQLKRDKELIYSHPLFPLLTVLFEKCELATCTPREPFREDDQVDAAHVCSASSFDEDLAEFAKTVRLNKPYYVPNPELDSLMLNAIQVLRYHLMELEKVHELCDNFCSKYVNKIKERTQMDINAGEAPPPAPLDQLHPHNHQLQHQQQHHQMASPNAAAMVDQQQHHHQHHQHQQHLQQHQQHFVGVPPPPQQFGEQMAAHMQALQSQPCSSTPHQMGFLDISSDGTTPSSVMNSNGSMVGTPNVVDFDQQQQQFYHAAAQQLHHQQQFGGMAPMGGGGAAENEEHFGGAKGKKMQKVKQPVKQHHHQPPPNGPSADQPSPDTTARTDSGSRSSTAAAMGSGEEQQRNGTATPGSTNGKLMNGMDGMMEETGDDSFSNCGDSMGEERDSGGSESEQKPNLKQFGGGFGEGGDEHGGGDGRKKVPKVFSKEAISKFRAWLFNNITHPYPTEEQKKQLATETGLTILQVNNWFINARRRIVQPMIDSNNRAGRPVQVFKNRRRKSSSNGTGAGGTSPSSVHEGGERSPELLSNGSVSGGGEAGGGAEEQHPPTTTMANNFGMANTITGSSSSSSASSSSASLLPLPSPSSSSSFSTASVMPSYQANAAAAAAAVAAISNPYASFASGTAAFPFAGMGGMSTMMNPYGLNPMASSGWASMDLNQTSHQGGLDG